MLPLASILGIFLPFLGLIIIIGLLASAFWFFALVDAARRQFYDPNMKIVWLIVIFLTHFIGALVYWIVGRQQGDL